MFLSMNASPAERKDHISEATPVLSNTSGIIVHAQNYIFRVIREIFEVSVSVVHARNSRSPTPADLMCDSRYLYFLTF